MHPLSKGSPRFASWTNHAHRARHPLVEVLGPAAVGYSSTGGQRLPIVSFMLRHADPQPAAAGGTPPRRYLHYNFVCAVLNDLFGIQSRGGCACAGPYGQAVLGIDQPTAKAFERALLAGQELLRPGFCRLSFPYFMSVRCPGLGPGTS
eukprot:SAG22_NODE_4304_length_1311_cov_1.489274_2_plen_149_part_00